MRWRSARVGGRMADPPRAPGDLATGGGVVTAGGGGWLTTLREQMEQYAHVADWIGQAVVWLIVIGAIIATAGFAYRWWAAREKAKLDDALDRKEGARA